MKKKYIKARVGVKLKKYLEEAYKGCIDIPIRDSTLLGIIIQNLELSPSGEEDNLDDSECVLIKLPYLNKKVYSQSDGRVYVCNTIWRDRLSEEGHRKVKKFFENNFKFAFHIFVDGNFEGQHLQKKEEARIKVKEAVVSFLLHYHIDFDEKLVEAMTRDWWRHNDQVEIYRASPMVY